MHGLGVVTANVCAAGEVLGDGTGNAVMLMDCVFGETYAGRLIDDDAAGCAGIFRASRALV